MQIALPLTILILSSMFLLNYFAKKYHGLVVKATRRGLDMKFKSGYHILQFHLPPDISAYLISISVDTGTANLRRLKLINGS